MYPSNVFWQIFWAVLALILIVWLLRALGAGI